MSEKSKYELDTEARLGAEKMPEPSAEAIDRAAHMLSEWLDDAAPLHERRYREPARSVLKFAAYLSTVSPLSDGDGWQPIESAPRDGSWFLGYRANRYRYGVQEVIDVWHLAKDDGGAFWQNAADSALDLAPTHWRALPAAPRDELAHE